jgi:hypothetical protein
MTQHHAQFTYRIHTMRAKFANDNNQKCRFDSKRNIFGCCYRQLPLAWHELDKWIVRDVESFFALEVNTFFSFYSQTKFNTKYSKIWRMHNFLFRRPCWQSTVNILLLFFEWVKHRYVGRIWLVNMILLSKRDIDFLWNAHSWRRKIESVSFKATFCGSPSPLQTS